MKKYLSVSLFLMFSLIVLQSCDRDATEVRAEANATALAGDWIVEQFEDEGINETAYFQGISFRFQASGEFIILRNNNEITRGNWRLLDNNRKLDINVPDFIKEEEAAQRFGDEVYEIHDDWDILEFSSTRIRMIDEDEKFTLVRR